MQTKDIAIIGGGIAGLTLAICLKNTRFKCHVFEKNPAFEESDAAICLFPNALRVFRHLGFMREVVDAGGGITKIVMKTQKGKILAQTEPRYQLPAICLHRKALHAILLKNAEATLYPDHSLESFQNLPDGRVNLTFANGVSRVFDALIGADGIHSMVRKGIIGDGAPIFRGYQVWYGIAETDLEINYTSETYGNGQRVGILPIKNGKYGWWATQNVNLSNDDAPQDAKQNLQTIFGGWHYPIPKLIAETSQILNASPSDRIPVRGWSKGNCTLLGDAAHPTTPTLGQGGCLAIEGAYILGEVIRKYGAIEIAFQQYEAIQFPRAKSIVESSLKLGQVGQFQNSIAVFFRNLFLRLTPSSITLNVIDKFFLYDVTALNI
ncbi:FAD-dependent monooxygenase [Dyadobacter sp. CY326]|uniref:FAD-dependent monooxygenase n=1 Tax=Dyadobacter sp. CY326 TaxID=2907300 RepID=UPI001F160A02|nr:FAD-dependent monooxygenase [Dyadobacter sp. CY326]MCE7065885.1 FAD-dependent monooxygenase [Dyadobacter sp. CY326]